MPRWASRLLGLHHTQHSPSESCFVSKQQPSYGVNCPWKQPLRLHSNLARLVQALLVGTAFPAACRLSSL